MRFSLKEFLTAVTLLSFWMAVIAVAMQLNRSNDPFWSKGIPGGLVGGSSFIFGQQVAYLFKKPYGVGLLIGILVCIPAMLLVLK